MRRTPSLLRFCTALFAVSCLTLAAVPEAQAGKGKPNLVRTSGQHVKAGRISAVRHHRQSRQGHFKQKRFQQQSQRSRFVRRRGDRRRNFRASGYYYGYDRGYRYRDTPRSEPSYRSEASAAVQSYQNRPVTPKWVHVSGTDGALGSSTVEGTYADGGLRRNCLSVKTEITVDGKPMDAFGEACLSADGTWELKPSQQNE